METKDLCIFIGDDTFMCYMQALVHSYMQRAYSTAKTKPYIKGHILICTPLNLAVQTGTLEWYKNNATMLVMFLSRTIEFFESISVEKFMTQCLQSLQHSIEMKNLNDSGHLNQNLQLSRSSCTKLFFYKLEGGTLAIVMYVACSSVSGQHEKLWFASAADMSHFLGSLKYITCIVLVVDIYVKYLPITICTGWEEFIKSRNAHADTGITYVCYSL